MAFSSYKVRVFVKAHTASESNFAGTYKLLMRCKSVPSPVQPPNEIETTDLEDDTQTFIKGIKTSGNLSVTGNLTKEEYEVLEAMGYDDQDLIFAYGNQGLGEELKYAFVGQVTPTVNDVGGADEVVEMTATITPSTSPVNATDGYTIAAATTAGQYTVTKNT